MKKILLIGDSIRVGYDKYVQMAFDGVAQVYYPDVNCRFAAYIMRHLPDWKKTTGCGDDVDAVYWNAGLWDDLVMVDDQCLTPVEIYEYYIDRICKSIRILFPSAKMIFATSTAVIEAIDPKLKKRTNENTRRYNAAAAKIVESHSGLVDDLFALTQNVPENYHSDQTHYYTPEGTELLAAHVVETLENVLSIQGKQLEYKQLFVQAQNVIGE